MSTPEPADAGSMGLKQLSCSSYANQRTSLYTDCESVFSIMPWLIENWRLVSRRRNEISFENISSIKHSCKFDLTLIFEEGGADIRGYQTSEPACIPALIVKLHHDNGFGSTFLLAVNMNSDKGVYTSPWLRANLETHDTQVLKFKLPALEKTDPYSFDQTTSDFVENDSLMITVRIEELIIIKKAINESCHLEEKPKPLTDFFKQFYTTQALVDVTFIVGLEKQTLHAHAVVLAAACPYFSSMFIGSNMKEQSSRSVDLTMDPDITFEVFQGFLDYVYGVKKVAEMRSITKELLVLADKYNYYQLCKACEIELCESLDKNNIASLLIFAHRYNLETLRIKALTLATNCGIGLGDVLEFLEIPKLTNLLEKLNCPPT